MGEDVTVDVDERVAVITMARGDANYFDHALLQEIADAGERLQSEGDCRAIVLCSDGKHFCAGADFGSDSMQGDRDRASAALYTQGIRLFDLDLPIVAAVQGAAVGGGLGLACAADFRVASSASRFHANFGSLGFHHGFALTVTLPRIVGAQLALDLLLTSRRLDGEEAHRIGLVDRLVETGREREATIAFARELAAQAPLALRAMKRTLRGDLAAQARAALDHELGEQQRLWRTEDSRIGVAASLARTVPVFVGR